MRLRIKGRGSMVLLGKMDGILNGTSPQEGRQDLVPKEGRQDLVGSFFLKDVGDAG